MLTVNRFHHIFRYSVLSFILVSSSDSLATDWYWTIPYGGTWDEGAYTWEDENGVNPPSGKPAAGDNAFLVVPYEWGDFLAINYRSTDNPLLENIVIEGRKVLSQRYIPGFSIPLNLNLTSNYEYIGGSPYTYNLPPSVVLPPIGILPEGVHEQDAGFNRVNNLLQIGGTEGSTGRYLLESYSDHVYGTLEVGQMEVIGAAGNGEFEQNGGYHLLDPGSSLIFGQSSTGTGSYNMISGWLEADIEILGAAGYGEFTQTSGWHEANQFTIGEQAGGRGEYTLDGGTLSVETETIGDGGRGNFIQNAGEHYVSSMIVGAQNLGYSSSYELNGGILDVTTETIGDGGIGHFNQYGGEHLVDTLVIGAQDSGLNSGFNLAGGTLDVAQTTKVGPAGDAAFYQAAGTSFTTYNLEVAEAGTSQSFYQMDGGLLHVKGSLILGESGEGTFYHYNGDVKIGPDGGTTGALSVTGSDDSYQMNGGTLTVNGSENISGTFRQIGGSHVLSENTSTQFLTNALNVGTSSNNGSYYISEGDLSSPRIKIGTRSDDGGFHQNGDNSTVSTTYLDIGVLPYDESIGEYHLSAGSLNIGDDSRLGTLNIGLIATNHLGNQTFGTGALKLEGGVLTVKGDMVAGAGGEGFVSLMAGQHTVTGSVNVGTSEYLGFINQTGGTFDIDGVLKVGVDGAGIYAHTSGRNTHVGNMLIEDYGTSITAGYTLGAETPPADPLPNPRLTFHGTEIIGFTKKGSFEHNYGYHTVNNELFLGHKSTGIGNYTLSGGELAVTGTETLGYNGGGVFDHIGGKHIVQGNLILGHGVDSRGTYDLKTGGELVVNGFETIGRLGSGTFNQFDGSHTVNGTLYIGGNTDENGGDGHYQMENGNLFIGEIGNAMVLGYGASEGYFTQAGGTVTVNRLEAAVGSSYASYKLIGGSLIADSETFGMGGEAVFLHENGVHEVNGDLNLGTLMNSEASYEMSNITNPDAIPSLYVVNNLIIGGTAGTASQWGHGALKQDLGRSSVRIDGQLFIKPNNEQADVGYRLSKGFLRNSGVFIEGSSYHLADTHRSDFVQEGGTHIINGDMLIGQGEEIDQGALRPTLYGNGGVYTLLGGSLTADSIIVEGYGFDLILSNNDWYHPGRFTGQSNLLNEDLVIQVNDHTFLNKGLTTFEGNGNSTVIGRVENRGLMTITETSIAFDGTFQNTGKVQSESSDVQFDQLIVEATGFMTGNSNDIYSITGDFINGSLENTLWNTDVASLIFNGTGVQNFYLAGDDLGVDGLGYQDNFAWGELIINSGVELTIFDGNIFEGAGLYVGALGLEDGVDTGSLLIDYILSDFNIYYDATLAENSYLQGMTFALNGEGFLMPSAVPVPPAVWLFGSGLLGLVAIARRKKV